MKYLSIVLLFIATSVCADQRFETVGGFCHFVTPQGFQNNNDDNEVFYANCKNSIRQEANGTGSGSSKITAKYPPRGIPFIGEHEYTGEETGVDCVMVDSNGTQYVTRDWNSKYSVHVPGLNKFRSVFGTVKGDEKYDRDFDFNEDGVINGLDIGEFRTEADGTVKYEIVCRNGVQQ